MSFFNLITPLAGSIAALLSISALLVLYFLKLRRREMPVSSTILWRKAVQDLQVNAPFQKLRKNLLLLLQLLVLLLLCAALSRPVVNSMSREDNACVIAFDDSAVTLCPLSPDGAKLRLAINSVEQTDRRSKLK